MGQSNTSNDGDDQLKSPVIEQSTEQQEVSPKGTGVTATNSVLAGLYARQAGSLLRYLRKILGTGPPDPEDVVQAAFAKVAARKDLGDINNPSAFLWRTAQNIVASEFRAAQVRDKHHLNVKKIFHEPKSDSFDPERVLIASAELSAVVAVLARMKPKRREVFILSRVEGMSVSEIARRLGVARTTVSKRLGLALYDLDAAMSTVEYDQPRKQ